MPPQRTPRSRVARSTEVETFTSRRNLCAAARAAWLPLLRRRGVDFEACGPLLQRRTNYLLRRLKARPARFRDEGAGAPLSARSAWAFEMDRKDWAGITRDGQLTERGAFSPRELAMLWILLVGITDVPAGRLREGMTVDDLLDVETNAMKQALKRHGVHFPRAMKPIRRGPRGE